MIERLHPIEKVALSLEEKSDHAQDSVASALREVYFGGEYTMVVPDGQERLPRYPEAVRAVFIDNNKIKAVTLSVNSSRSLDEISGEINGLIMGLPGDFSRINLYGERAITALGRSGHSTLGLFELSQLDHNGRRINLTAYPNVFEQVLGSREDAILLAMAYLKHSIIAFGGAFDPSLPIN